MSNDLQSLRLSHSIPARDMAETVQKIYPRFDRYLLSKCESPEVYGVQIRHDALKALYLKYDPEAWTKRKRRTDGHKNRSRVYCRMDEATYKKLIAQIRQDGFKSVKDWIMDQILAYINATN